ncbi:uncharacterized protein [Watersipora subatra]|uniref:uncharacterized protein n=1 Tax=Watersipora subatra TaxID=2589382 RepID=UPI00355BBA78
MFESRASLLICYIFLVTTDITLAEISGVRYGANNMTEVLYTPYWTAYHFEKSLSSQKNILFSSYEKIRISSGADETSLKNNENIVQSEDFRIISGFCQNGTHILMVDYLNHCIRSTQYLTSQPIEPPTTIAGRCGQAGFNNGNAFMARFNEPQSIYRVKQGNQSLYLITDKMNDAIRIFSSGNSKVSTFLNDSIKLPEPIDLIASENGSYLYVTVKTGLVKVEIASQQITAVDLPGKPRLYKIIAITPNVYVTSARFDNRLIIISWKSGTLESEFICTGERESKVGNASECKLNRPHGLFWDEKTSSIVVGCHQYIRRLKVNIGDSANFTTQILQWPTTVTTYLASSNYPNSTTLKSAPTLALLQTTYTTSSPFKYLGWSTMEQCITFYTTFGILLVGIAGVVIALLRVRNMARQTRCEMRPQIRHPSSRLPRQPQIIIPSHTTTIDPYGGEIIISSCHSSSQPDTLSSCISTPLIPQRTPIHRIEPEYTPMGNTNYYNHRFHNNQHACAPTTL